MEPFARINNRDPRRDLAGNIIDIHDGSLEQFEGRFYWYGTTYGDTDGFTHANIFRVYSSSNLQDWTAHGDILPDKPVGVYYRPYVKYCASSRQYVLWYNWYPTLWNGQYGVAVSQRPEGPFRIVNMDVRVKHPRPGDFGLFVEDDGSGYLIYTSIESGHRISVEKLEPEYTSSTLENGGFFSEGKEESPTLFKRNGIYYALFDTYCCFGPGGTGVKVFTASNPLGPFTFQSNINRTPSPCGDVPTIPAQQAHVAKLAAQAGDIFVWVGDRWGSRPDGIKGHDFQFWTELQFDERGVIAPMRWSNEWSFRLTNQEENSAVS